MQLADPSAYLLPGEHWMWTGEPRQGLVTTAGDALMIPFSLMWGGFAIFWETTVVFSGAPFFFMLWGIPFVLVGLYLIVGRFFVDAWLRRRTAYILTDKRVLIVRAGPSASTVSLNLRTLSEIELKEGPGGRGTIQFGRPADGRRFAMPGWPGAPSVPAFFQIEDARGVYARIQSLQERRTD